MSYPRIEFALKRNLSTDNYWPPEKKDTPKQIYGTQLDVQLEGPRTIVTFAINLKKKLEQLRLLNKDFYKSLLDDAKDAGLGLNEFGDLILCKISLEPDVLKQWHDYFLIENSLGSTKLFNLVQHERYVLNGGYHSIVKAWYTHAQVFIEFYLSLSSDTYSELLNQILTSQDDQKNNVKADDREYFKTTAHNCR